MPGTNASVSAVFTNIPPPEFLLTVVNGTGGGSYAAGTLVSLTASNAPIGQYFAGWLGAAVSDAAAPVTFLLMPAMDTNVVATYSNVARVRLAIPAEVGNGMWRFLSLGVPGLGYSVLGTTNVEGSNGWSVVGPVIAAPDGSIAFDFTNGPGPRGFFQLRYP